MNGQLMAYWGRTMLAAFQGRNQMDTVTDWLQDACQDMARLNSSFLQLWGMPPAPSPLSDFQRQWEQAWEPFLRLQELSLQWVGMVSPKEYAAQSKKIVELEEQVQDQARTIEKLRSLLSNSGEGNNQLVHQFQKLIDQQSKQFQQLTSSVSEYIKSSAEKAGKPDKQ